MSKQYLVLCFVILYCISCHVPTNSSDCSKLKEGKFYYFTRLNRRKVLVDRHDSIQIETDTRTGDISKSKIIWKGKCEYEIFVDAYSPKKLSFRDSVFSTIPILITLSSVSSNFYVASGLVALPDKNVELRDTFYFQK